MPSVKLYGKHCYSIRFSPFFPQYLACTACENYGLKGAGSLILLENDNSNHLKVRRNSYWGSGLSDVSWWKNNEDILVTGSTDGSIQLWKLFGRDSLHPLRVFREHSLDVSCVDSKHNLIASSSWDSTVKIWDANGISSILTLKEGEGMVHSVKWSDAFPNLLASASNDNHLILWDKNKPVSSIHKVESQNLESLDCEWNLFNPYEVGVCGSDSVVKIWDIRSLKSPVHILKGHNKAVSRIRWFPHAAGIIGTSSYDLNVVVWDVNKQQTLEIVRHHSGFIFGLDFSPFNPGQIADCSLDSLVHVYTPWSLHSRSYHHFLKNKM